MNHVTTNDLIYSKHGQQRSCTCAIFLRDIERSLVVPIICVKIWETAEVTGMQFCSSFGPETLLLHVWKRPSTARNFDANHKRWPLTPYIWTTCNQRIHFLWRTLNNMIKNFFCSKFCSNLALNNFKVPWRHTKNFWVHCGADKVLERRGPTWRPKSAHEPLSSV